MLKSSRKNTLLLSFTLLVVMLGYGMVMPVMPFYIEMLGAGGQELGWLVSIYSLMQLIFAPLWGNLSDRVGRKPIIAIGVFGYALSMFLFGLATRFWMIFLARTLAGILSSATMPTSMAYIGDHAPEEERSSGMGQLGAAMGAGIIIGPLLGGLLSSQSLSLPFFIGAGMAFLACLLVLLLLPEPKSAAIASRSKQPLSWKKISAILFSPIGLILFLILIISFGLSNFQGIIGLYAVDKYDGSTAQVGSLWMVVGAVMILGQGVLTGPLSRRLGELPLIRSALAAGVLGFGFIAMAPNFLVLMIAVGFFTLSLALIGPTLNAHISRYATENQGTVMGLNSAVSSLGRVVGPLLAGFFFDIRPEYPFYSGAVILLSGTLLSFILLKNRE